MNHPDEVRRRDVLSAATSNDLALDGIVFRTAPHGGGPGVSNDAHSVVLLKSWDFVRDEFDILAGLEPRRMLEFGVYQGGSAILWSLLLPLDKYVGIDIREEPTVPPEVASHPRWQVVRLHAQTSQGDRETVERIIDEEFGGGLDVILDDASHQYELTRAAFEVSFPRLRPGGVYVIEDWGWAHVEGPFTKPDHPWAQRPGLANLVLRLVLIAAAKPRIIPEIIVRRHFVVVRRGAAVLERDFDIDRIAGEHRPLPALF